MNDDIFADDYIPPIIPATNKFKFCKGDAIKFDRFEFHIYEVTANYVTIKINEALATAKLMEFMESRYDAVYIGPMLQGHFGVHLTFKRKTRE